MNIKEYVDYAAKAAKDYIDKKCANGLPSTPSTPPIVEIPGGNVILSSETINQMIKVHKLAQYHEDPTSEIDKLYELLIADISNDPDTESITIDDVRAQVIRKELLNNDTYLSNAFSRRTLPNNRTLELSGVDFTYDIDTETFTAVSNSNFELKTAAMPLFITKAMAVDYAYIKKNSITIEHGTYDIVFESSGFPYDNNPADGVRLQIFLQSINDASITHSVYVNPNQTVTFEIPEGEYIQRIALYRKATVTGMNATFSVKMYKHLGTLMDYGLWTADLPDELISLDKLKRTVRPVIPPYNFSTVQKILQTAETYFKKAYTPKGQEGGFHYLSSHGMFYPDIYTEPGVYGIVCSQLVEAVIKGIPFEKSRYNGLAKNQPEGWGYSYFDGSEKRYYWDNDYDFLQANELALYCQEHGWTYDIVDSNFENVMPGDMMFMVNDDTRTNSTSYLQISHVAFVIHKFDDGSIEIVESSTFLKKPEDSNEVGMQIVRTKPARPIMGARVPLNVIDGLHPKCIASIRYPGGCTKLVSSSSHYIANTVYGGCDRGFLTFVLDGEGLEDASICRTGTDGSVWEYEKTKIHKEGSKYITTIYLHDKATNFKIKVPSGRTFVLNGYDIFRGFATADMYDVSNHTIAIDVNVNDITYVNYPNESFKDQNGVYSAIFRAMDLSSGTIFPSTASAIWFMNGFKSTDDYAVEEIRTYSTALRNKTYRRCKSGGVWTNWYEI